MVSLKQGGNSLTIQVKLHQKNNWLKSAGYTQKEEGKIFEDQLVDILANLRWYLDHAHALKTYRVSWQEYKDKRHRATFPLRYVVKKTKDEPLTPQSL